MPNPFDDHPLFQTDGKVEGLYLRGGKVLKVLEWKDGKIVRCEVEEI